MTTPLPVKVAQAETLWHAATENCVLGTNELVSSAPLPFKLQMLQSSLTGPKEGGGKGGVSRLKFFLNNGLDKALNFARRLGDP